MPTIKKQDVIDAIEEAGFEHKDISERLFRITIEPRRYSFIEIIPYREIAFNSVIIGAIPELKARLAELRNESEPARKRRRRTQTNTDSTFDDTERTVDPND